MKAHFCLGACVVGAWALWGCGQSGQSTQSSAPPQTSSPPAAVERVEATVETVGTKGRSYGGGIITEPVSQLFKQKDRITLMQLEQALKLYKAQHGRLPRTHEEFMREIVNNPQYGIRLPELPPGHEYVWDPQQGKLLVQRPASSAQEK